MVCRVSEITSQVKSSQGKSRTWGISLLERRKLLFEAFGVSPPRRAPAAPETASGGWVVSMGPRLNAPSAQFTYFDVHAHTDTPQTGPSAA